MASTRSASTDRGHQMLRTVGDQPTLWETILPASALRMSEELELVDRLLDDPRFFAPYQRFFHDRLGRPSIPIARARPATTALTWARLLALVGMRTNPTPVLTRTCGDRKGLVHRDVSDYRRLAIHPDGSAKRSR